VPRPDTIGFRRQPDLNRGRMVIKQSISTHSISHGMRQYIPVIFVTSDALAMHVHRWLTGISASNFADGRLPANGLRSV